MFFENASQQVSRGGQHNFHYVDGAKNGQKTFTCIIHYCTCNRVDTGVHMWVHEHGMIGHFFSHYNFLITLHTPSEHATLCKLLIINNKNIKLLPTHHTSFKMYEELEVPNFGSSRISFQN